MNTCRRAFVVVVAACLVLVGFAGSAGAAARPLTCLGGRVTIVADPGGGITWGTPGDDVIFGTAGDDVILGNGGNDRICGRGGDDVIYAFAPSTMPVPPDLRTPECLDSVDLEPAYRISIDGGSGNDMICGPSAIFGGFWTADGGPGNDTVGRALGVDERITGGSGDDLVLGGLHYPGNLNRYSRAYGGPGNDVIHAGESFIFLPNPGEPYRVFAAGEGGNDTITGAMVDGLRGRLSGGSGIDTCTVILGWTPNALLFHPSCETKII